MIKWNQSNYIQEFLNLYRHSFSKCSLIQFWSSNQLKQYLSEEHIFSLALNRPAGKGILYGLDHIKTRQSFFNLLPKDVRIKLISKKLSHFNFWLLFEEALGCKVHSSLLYDVLDIGAGHSVYLLKFQNFEYVLKEENLQTHCFMSTLLNDLGWASLKTFHITYKNRAFELTEYAGEYTLEKWLKSLKKPVSKTLLKNLSYHAALGDCIGRGDRHFENYVLKEHSLIPIDFTYLFSEHHEWWVMTYTKAGMNEIGALQSYIHHAESLYQYLDFFLKQYRLMFNSFINHNDLFERLINTYFKDQASREKYANFFKDRLQHPMYAASQCQSYVMGFLTFIKRYAYKQLLQLLVHKHPEVFKYNAYLTMYYQADLNRYSSFFQLDEFNRGYLLDLIEGLAKFYQIDVKAFFKPYDHIDLVLRKKLPYDL